MISPPVAILAGGLATRLRPITETIPKSLVTVAGKPFLAHQLNYLRSQGVLKVVLCVGYLGEMIREQFRDGEDFGVQLEYSFDGPVLLGTGGAIKQALPLLGDQFFVLYGDSYLPINFEDVYRRFEDSEMAGLMTVFPNFGKWDVSNVWFENGKIRKYSKIDLVPQMNHVDYGLSLFSTQVFAEMESGTPSDLAGLMSALAEKGELAGYVAQNRFYEIGSHSGLEELNSYLGGNE